MEWSKYQLDVFSFVEGGKGSAIVEAVAGSGKTTTLVEAVSRLRGSAYLAAFNKRIGEELKARISGLQWKDAGTFHSAGFRALTSAAPRGAYTVEGRKCQNLWEDYCEYKGKHEWLSLTSVVCRLVAAAKQNVLGLEDPIEEVGLWEAWIEHFGLLDDAPEGTTVEALVGHAQTLLRLSLDETRIIDFDDMLYLPLLHHLRPMKFDTVLVDEAQDTNKARLYLARAMCKTGGRVIAVGDPKQAIYGFSGASATALDQIEEMFDAERLPLSVSYRCAQEVVKHAKQWAPAIEWWEQAPIGKVSSGELSELLTVWKPTVGEALLCRFNRPLMRLAFALIRKGIPARIEGKEIGEGLVALTKKWHVEGLEDLRAKVEQWASREAGKCYAKKNPAKAQLFLDKGETMGVLIERAEVLHLNVEGLQRLIREMFQDSEQANKRIFTLSSIHKAKGLEWGRVFHLGRGEVVPSPYATQAWEVEQEHNLIYVATTRAKEELVELSGVKESLAENKSPETEKVLDKPDNL